MKNKQEQLNEQNINLYNAINLHSKDKSKADLKLTIMDDTRMIFTKNNGFEPLKNHVFMGYKIKDNNNPFITIKQINRTLDKFKKKMLSYALNGYRSWHITFSVSLDQIKPQAKELIDEMDRRLSYIEACLNNMSTEDNPFYYVGRYEGNEEDGLLHFHLGIFYKKYIPKTITHEWLKQIWGLGNVWLSRHKKVWTILGYISKIRETDFLDSTYTKFPSCMKIIRHSTYMPITNNIVTIYTDYEGYREILAILNKKSLIQFGEFLYKIKDYVQYVDVNTGETYKYLKSMYIY